MRRAEAADRNPIGRGLEVEGRVEVASLPPVGRAELLATAVGAQAGSRSASARTARLPFAATPKVRAAGRRPLATAAILAFLAAAALWGFGLRQMLEFPRHPALIERFVQSGTEKGRELLDLSLRGGAILLAAAWIASAFALLVARPGRQGGARALAIPVALAALGLSLPLPGLMAAEGLLPFLLAAALGTASWAFRSPLLLGVSALGVAVQPLTALIFMLPALAIRAFAVPPLGAARGPVRGFGICLGPGLLAAIWALWPKDNTAWAAPERPTLAVFSALLALLVLARPQAERRVKALFVAALTAALLALAMAALQSAEAPSALARGVAIAFAVCAALHAAERRPLRLALLAIALFAILAGELEVRLAEARAWRGAAGLAKALEERAQRLAEVPGVQDFVAGVSPLGLNPRGLPFLWPHGDVLPAASLAAVHPERPLRILRFESELPPQLATPSQYRLSPIFQGHIASSEALRLLEPRDGAVLSLQNPDDEPVFSWSVPIEQDPGPEGFRLLAVGPTKAQPGGGLRARRLSESVLERVEREDRVHYAFRPSLRAQEGRIEPELRFEDGDLILPGFELLWTIAVDCGPVGSSHRIAPPWRLSARP